MVREMIVKIRFECDCEPVDPAREAVDPAPTEEQVCDIVEKAIREQIQTPPSQWTDVMEAANEAVNDLWARACDLVPSHVSVGGSAQLTIDPKSSTPFMDAYFGNKEHVIDRSKKRR